MARRALVIAGWACSTFALGIAACGESDESASDDRSEGGQAAEGGEMTTTGSGGTLTGGDGGGGAAASGSRGGSPDRGGSAGRSGTTGATGGSSRGGATSGRGGFDGEAGGGGADGGEGGTRPDPVVCDRLAGTERAISERVALAYDLTRHRDCRLAWFESLFLPPIDQRLEYVRAIALQSRILWGCSDEPLSGFSLVYGEVPLSQAEADALIGVYLNASRIEMQLSPSEVAPIERTLLGLAAPLVEPTLADFSRSRCPDGGIGGRAGAGGQGGAGDPSGAGGAF